MIGWLNKLHHWSWIWLDGSCWIIICRRKGSFHICKLGLKGECWRVTDWYVKRMQLKHNLSLIVIWDPSIYVYFNYKVNLLIGREKIFATLYHGYVKQTVDCNVDFIWLRNRMKKSALVSFSWKRQPVRGANCRNYYVKILCTSKQKIGTLGGTCAKKIQYQCWRLKTFMAAKQHHVPELWIA